MAGISRDRDWRRRTDFRLKPEATESPEAEATADEARGSGLGARIPILERRVPSPESRAPSSDAVDPPAVHPHGRGPHGHPRRARRLHPLQAARAGTEADRVRRGESGGGHHVRRRGSGGRRRYAGRAVRRARRPAADEDDRGDGPLARRGLHRQRAQVPAAEQPRSAAGRSGELRAVPVSADCRRCSRRSSSRSAPSPPARC